MLALVLLFPAARAAPHPSGGYGGLGYHNAPEPAPLSNASAESVRRLQASARPDKCNDDASYQAWLDVVNQACCARASSPW